MTASLDQVRASIIGLLPRLRRFARTITRNYDDADDLVQIAVERALQRYEQWRPEARFEGWIFGIVRNVWIDEVRAHQRRNLALAPAEARENMGGGDGETQTLSIRRAVAGLPEDQRMANTTPAATTNMASVTNSASVRPELRGSSAPAWTFAQWSAIAASLVAGVLIGRVGLQRDEDLFVTDQGRMTAHGELTAALSIRAGGALDRDTGIQIGVSYLAKNGDYCRTFTLRRENMLAGLACRRQNSWTIDALTRTNANASGAYRMAGAALPALLLGIVESTIAGDPLDAEQQAEARERGWQR